MNIEEAMKGLAKFPTEQLYTAYKRLKAKQPQLPEYRRAALAVLEEIEARGRAEDKFVAGLRA